MIMTRPTHRVDEPALLVRAVAPIGALLLGYPVWWALGIQIPLWVVAAVPVGLWLLVNRRSVVLPPGYGVLAVFIGWVLISGVMLSTPRYLAAYGFRLSLYLAVALMAVLVWNALARGLSARRVLLWLTALWAAAILLAYPGILFNNLQFTSPFEAITAAVGLDDPFVRSLTHPQFSEYDGLYGSPRPSALFAYTNDWGAAVGILFPVAVHMFLVAPRRVERALMGLLLVVAVPAIIVSLNRGSWISIAVAVGYVLVRRTVAGDLKVLGAVVGGALAVVGTVLAVEPLRRIITARFDYSNTSTRETLYGAAWDLALQSPLFGWGAPQSSAGLANSNDVSIGTHGQLWTILVSQGLVGTGLFLAAAGLIWWHARPRDARSPDVWLHATGVVLVVQLAFYEVLPVPLAVALFAMAVTGVRRLHPAAQPVPAPTGAADGTHRPRKVLVDHE